MACRSIGPMRKIRLENSEQTGFRQMNTIICQLDILQDNQIRVCVLAHLFLYYINAKRRNDDLP